MKIDAEKVIRAIDSGILAHKKIFKFFLQRNVNKGAISALITVKAKIEEIIKEEEQRAEHQTNYKIDIDLFDEAELYPNCTVQVLHNTITDEYSVGWWQN